MSVSGISFVATFSDGEVVRMSISTSAENLDLARAKTLAAYAYRSRIRCRRRAKDVADRKKHCPLIDAPWPTDELPVVVPPMVEISFVDTWSGAVLKTFNMTELAAA
jgi:hypothetical protein